MIILRITSGLGNQMYQYAFYTLLKEKYKDTEVLCDTTWFHSNFEGRRYELERVFSGVNNSLFEIKKASVRQIINLSGRVPNLFDGTFGVVFDKIRWVINRLLKNNKLKSRKPYIIEQYGQDSLSEDEFYNAVMNLDTTKDYYITGFFIEEKFYSQVIDRVRDCFLFRTLSEEWNIAYAEKINNCESVSIHVRRGDYLSDIYKDKFLTLGKDYYEAAINYVREHSDDSSRLKFFIFSDDADFVKEEFKWINDKVVITGNSGDLSYRDMQLMSMCKYNIIANSTFSQWAALLNVCPKHLVIYPRAYMTDTDNEVKSDKNWIMI